MPKIRYSLYMEYEYPIDDETGEPGLPKVTKRFFKELKSSDSTEQLKRKKKKQKPAALNLGEEITR